MKAKTEEIRKRFLDGKEVVDAQTELRVFIEPADIKKATPSDPHCCAFAQACRRLYKSQSALFLETVAYVDLPDENGKKRVERFQLTAPVQKQIQQFDETGIADPGGYTLSAPTPSYTMQGKADQRARLREKQRKALLNGEIITPNRTNSPMREKTRQWGVRQGRGMAQFHDRGNAALKP